MHGEARKSAILAYKERKSAAGIYRVQCDAAGAQWVGHCPDLDTIQNRIWFGLRTGGAPNRHMQRAWHDHGARSFSFSVLEILPQDVSPYGRHALGKALAAHWQARLGAPTI